MPMLMQTSYVETVRATISSQQSGTEGPGLSSHVAQVVQGCFWESATASAMQLMLAHAPKFMHPAPRVGAQAPHSCAQLGSQLAR